VRASSLKQKKFDRKLKKAVQPKFSKLAQDDGTSPRTVKGWLNERRGGPLDKTKYDWQELCKAAVLETDWMITDEKIQAAANGIKVRLHEFSMNHGGPAEERQGIEDALEGLDSEPGCVQECPLLVQKARHRGAYFGNPLVIHVSLYCRDPREKYWSILDNAGITC
jgi:hypothetical protein